MKLTHLSLSIFLLLPSFASLFGLSFARWGTFFLVSQSHEFLFFAALMALDMVLFGAMACFYQYVDPAETSCTTARVIDSTASEKQAYELVTGQANGKHQE